MVYRQLCYACGTTPRGLHRRYLLRLFLFPVIRVAPSTSSSSLFTFSAGNFKLKTQVFRRQFAQSKIHSTNHLGLPYPRIRQPTVAPTTNPHPYPETTDCQQNPSRIP
ncbi:hypothetical protein AAHA92_33564 [Salvia divinorum]|uniref:Uncharacterized protein n=1 Tax=Salvia divinorum TaxID=28513 RepID=A0ABD1FPE9_SALDI